MFHNRKLNNHIYRIHERALWIAYQDHDVMFNELLAKVTKHSHCRVWNWNCHFCWLKDMDQYAQWTKGGYIVNEFKSKIKTSKPENCSCKLCKIYLQRIGYLQTSSYWLAYIIHRCYYQCFFIFLPFLNFFFLFYHFSHSSLILNLT